MTKTIAQQGYLSWIIIDKGDTTFAYTVWDGEDFTTVIAGGVADTLIAAKLTIAQRVNEIIMEDKTNAKLE